jgi:hypothetical protein
MGRPSYLRLSRDLTNSFLLAACLFCTASCHNTCVSGTLGSPGSTVNVKIASPPPSCMLSTANGIVHLEIGAAPGPASLPGTIGPHIAHLFVTLAGVDAHPSALADDDAPGWLPLAKQLQTHPVQVDLLADAQTGGSLGSFPDAILPAGAYRQVRLRLATLVPDGPGLEHNQCGVGAHHCAVMSDGRIQPVAFSLSTLNLRILPGSIQQELYVPSDSAVTVKIEFDPDRSFLWNSRNSGAWSSGDPLLLAPVFHLNIQQPPGVS